ncbi:MAG: WecB/TagA/CpsF family glycosyltransferase [Pseudomonadota bacterium]
MANSSSIASLEQNQPSTGSGSATHHSSERDVETLNRRDDFQRNVWSVAGLPIDMATVADAVSEVEQAARTSRRLTLVTPNINMLCNGITKPSARADILMHDFSVADGLPLVKIAQFLGAPISSRCAGSDVFEGLQARSAPAGRQMKVFFFGGRDGAADAAAKALAERPGGFEPVGALNPGFGSLEELSADHFIDEINQANPDFIVVALGSERGNAWIIRNQDRLTAPVISHLGAVVDFTAGGIARAPKWMARAGLEWAWRIKEEPSLWKRYWHDAVSLAKLMVTRIVPLKLIRQKSAGAPAEAELKITNRDVVVRLSGDLTVDHLGPVRDVFRQAASTGCPVILDMSKTGQIDAAFLGLVLMLEKAFVSADGKAASARLTTAGLTSTARAIFRCHGLNFPEVELTHEHASDEDLIAPLGQTA